MFKLTLKDVNKILDTEVGHWSPKAKLCGKCDYYDTINHAGLKCNKCGGEPKSISTWTVFNAIKRTSIHFRNNKDRGQEATWFITFVAHYLEEKHKIDFSKTYGWAFDNYSTIKPLYIQAVKERE